MKRIEVKQVPKDFEITSCDFCLKDFPDNATAFEGDMVGNKVHFHIECLPKLLERALPHRKDLK